jgi:hypothetical protein
MFTELPVELTATADQGTRETESESFSGGSRNSQPSMELGGLLSYS